MGGAIMSHLAILGIEIMGDGGLLFALGMIVFFAGLGILYIRRAEIPIVGSKLSPKAS